MKGQTDTLQRVLETFQQDTPPSSAGSLLAHTDMEIMTDLKPLPVMSSSPNHQEVFAYQTTSPNNICDFQPDRLLLQSAHRSQIQKTPSSSFHEEDSEVLAVLEPIPHNGLIDGGLRSQNTVVNGHTENDLYWNEVWGDQDLEMDSLTKYRPEESISTVVNTALALNEDLFSSDGSSSDLPNELDLVTTVNLDLGSTGHGIQTTTDWWGFQHPTTSLLSISVPFGNTDVPSSVPSTNSVLANNNNNGVFINSYVQNASPYMMDRQSIQQQHQDLLQSQQWQDCKVALDAAALDLDDLGDLDTVHAY